MSGKTKPQPGHQFDSWLFSFYQSENTHSVLRHRIRKICNHTVLN